ncbi:hypothetical protein GWN91_08485, partial [Candidatus Saccharibacteria bacterium]|nr:hypothetical protein [Candidatus Saccharibacteria bacterium]NIV73213.1 hypothetical protein [Calditrichia bacterium]NIW80936.1 hypothetical protein [Calditrichia bacterium]
MYNLHFEQAEKTFVEAQSEFPDYPHGYVYQAYIAAIVYSMDRKDDSLEQILNRHIEQASEVAEDYKDRMEETADSHFYLGLLRGIKALAHATNRSYIKAYWDGRKAKSDLEKTVDLNPEYYDAYLGLGLFQYYVALLPGVLKFFAKLLGFEGDRYKAMQQIELSAEEGQYFRVEAEFLTHSTRYFLEGDTTTTIPALKKMYEEYPENQAIGLLLAYHYRRYGFIQKCIDYCKSFTDEHGRILPLITNLKYYNLAVSYYDLNQ